MWTDIRPLGLTGVTLALALSCASARADCAQGGPARPLTDADVTRIMPLLKVNISDLQAARASVAAATRIIEETDDALTKRTLDPLPWLKAHGQEIVVPPAARYDSSCSKSASRFHSIPMAVFTLTPAAEVPAPRAPRVPPPSTALAAARSFYQSRGFQSRYVLSLYDGTDTWTYDQRDGSEYNVFSVNYLTVHEKLAGCESMPPGPMVARPLHASAAASPPAWVLDRALGAAGMSRDEYDDAVSALIAARRLAGGDATTLESLEELLPRMSGAELARNRAFIAASKANLAVFLAHATALEPLLASYVRLMDLGK